MKLNIAYPATGCQKIFEIDDEKKLRPFYEKRMAQEVEGDSLGDEWKGYIFRVTGGNDKQGFPMKQGVLTNGRVRLLLGKGHSCYRQRRKGERKRKSVRGCIVDSNLSVLSLIIVKKGDGEVEGLTDKTIPKKLGPKRASKIRRLFNLSKEDDVRKYVLRRTIQPKEEGKKVRTRAPKIQRLVTPIRLQRKRRLQALKQKRRVKNREEAAVYQKLLAKYAKERQAEKEARRRSSASASKSDAGEAVKPTVKPAVKPTVKAVDKSEVAGKVTKSAQKVTGGKKK